MKRILILEPYYGGSHKHFLDGLQKHVRANYRLFTLPARNWKRRMRLSALWFVEQIKAIPLGERQFDSVLCSSFTDVAVLRALLAGVHGWNPGAKVLTYFHENQFVYPRRFHDPGQFQFTAINFHSALASDGIAFNSAYNRKSFLAGCRKGLKAALDMKFSGIIKNLTDKAIILSPGIDFSEIDRIKWKKTSETPVIVWNHRWEHDKNPESFFLALQQLEQRGLDFRLIVLGQSFSASPACFADGEKYFQEKILHYGFVPSYEKYVELLCQGDIVVSTSLHEFYGISIIEAVRAGCLPVLPNRLSYPELFENAFLYSDGSLAERLEKVITDSGRLTRDKARAMTDRFAWPSLRQMYSEWL
jgi:glycosyltransferase involved in cell wall biosynthesis